MRTFNVFEAEFENEAVMMNALSSKEGQAVAADVPNYATAASPWWSSPRSRSGPRARRAFYVSDHCRSRL